jgi:hypothetical protein
MGMRAGSVAGALLHLAFAAGLLGVPTAPVHAQNPQHKVLPTFTAPKMPQLSTLPSKGQAKVKHWARKFSPQAITSKAQLAQIIQGGPTIPLWQGSDTTECCGTFDFIMVGKDPTVKQSNPVTGITAEIIPVKFTFIGETGNVVFDPSKKDACGPRSAVSMLMSSPIFTPIRLTIGETFLGKGQYVSLFQRANFWQYTKPGGINPGYQVSLVPQFLGVLPVNVLGGDIAEGGCGPEGLIDINTFDAFLQNTILPALGQFGVGPLILPVFLFENVVMADGDLCCILGYHSSFINQHGTLQTYVVANYETNGFFGEPDTVVMSHEISEWMNNPTVSNTSDGNIVPVWFSTYGGGVGCQNNLEVGDPLEAGIPETSNPPAIYQIKMPGFTYSVQDLAFKAWFFQDDGSTVANGFGSLFGTFDSPSAFHEFCEAPC